MLRTYPEYEDKLSEDLRVIATEGEVGRVSGESKGPYKSKNAASFFDILYENSLFDPANEDAPETLELLPGLDVKALWTAEGTSDATRATLWKYLQLILFNVVGDMSSGDGFGEAAHLFEAINEDELKSKLEETVNHFQSMFEANAEEGEDEQHDGEGGAQLPDPEQLHSHITEMMGGKIGSLAKEIAEDTAKELGIEDLEGDGKADVNTVFSKLFRNPGKLISLVKKMGGKLDSKIKSGELKESELLEEASQFMSKMKSMPGMGGLQSMLRKMGMSGAGGGMSKAGMAAMQNQMNRNMASARQRERCISLRLKSQKEGRGKSEESTKAKFTEGEKAERTPRVPATNLLCLLWNGLSIKERRRGRRLLLKAINPRKQRRKTTARSKRCGCPLCFTELGMKRLDWVRIIYCVCNI